MARMQGDATATPKKKAGTLLDSPASGTANRPSSSPARVVNLNQPARYMQSSSPTRPRTAASPGSPARDQKAIAMASSQLNTSGIDGESYSEAVKRLNAQSAQLQKKLSETLNRNSELEKHIGRLEAEGRTDAVDFSSLRQSQKTAQVLKKVNENLQRKYETVTNTDKMVDLENQLNAKLFELRKLEDENRTLLKVSREQEKRLASAEEMEADFSAQIRSLMEEIRATKDRVRNYKQQSEEANRVVRTQQTESDKLKKAIHRLEARITERKGKPININEERDNLKVRLANLEDQLASENERNKQLQERKEASTRLHKQKLSDAYTSLKDLKASIEELTESIQTKDKELKVNLVKFKITRDRGGDDTSSIASSRMSFRRGTTKRSPPQIARLAEVEDDDDDGVEEGQYGGVDI